MNRRSALDLYTGDGKARWRLLYASMLLAFPITFFALRLGASPNQSLTVTVSVSVLAYVVGIANNTSRSKTEGPSPYSLRASLLTRTDSKLAIATLAALVVGVETPGLAAAVLNRRLQVALQIKQPEKRSKETRRILVLATQSHAALRPELVEKAKEELDESAKSLSATPVISPAEWLVAVAAVED